MERAQNGLSLLFSHDHKTIIGRATDIRLDPDRIMRGTLTFREGEHWDMVRDGDLTDVSVGYRVDHFEETETGYRATKWTPVEVSMVAVPADPAVGIGRSMTTENDDMDTPDLDRVRKEAVKAEQARVSKIKHQFKALAPKATELMDDVIERGLSVEDAMTELATSMEAESAQTEATATVRAQPTGTDGEFQSAMADAFEYRSGNVKQFNQDGTPNPEWRKLHDRVTGNRFRQYSMVDMARYDLESRGIHTAGLSGEAVLQSVFTRAVDGPLNQTTASFPNLLADQINKGLLTGWLEAPETWSQWCQTSSASDFKPGSRVHVSNFTSLDVVPENNDYTEGTVSDFAEPFQVKTYGKLWSVTRQALVNDDVGGLTRTAQLMGRAASRAVGDAVYAVLTGNPAMSDTNELFSAAHANVGGGGAPDPDTVDELRRLIALQTDTNSITLGLVLRYLLVPLELENAARIVVNSTTNPVDNQAAGIVNPINSFNLQVVGEHRLSADSATAWYGAATSETVEVVWLNGVSVPMIESEPNWKRDGVHYKVRIDFDVLPVDWRGLAANADPSP